MKDYVSVAGSLGVTHILTITQTKRNIVLRIGKASSGPTLHFRIPQYSLGRYVRALQKRPYESSSAYLTPPLVVLNNFGQVEEAHLKLMRITFQNMFPSINVNTIKLGDCRRVVLFHRKDDGNVEMRQYAIKANPVGINRSIKKVLQSKVPNLCNLEDISEFIEKQAAAGDASDSEAEDEGAKIVLPDRYHGKGNAQSQQSAIKLIELGPRICLELYKVEQGLCEGDILYHKYESKTPEEAAATKARVEKLRLLKIERKAKQEANVKRKKEEKEQKKVEKDARKKRRLEEGGAAEDEEDNDDDDEDDNDDGNDDEDDGDNDDEDNDDDDDGEYDDDDYEDVNDELNEGDEEN